MLVSERFASSITSSKLTRLVVSSPSDSRMMASRRTSSCLLALTFFELA